MKNISVSGTESFIVLLLIITLQGCGGFQGNQKMQANISVAEGDYVVVVHGLGRTWRSMKKTKKFLEQRGYHVVNVNYPSTKYDIATLIWNSDQVRSI